MISKITDITLNDSPMPPQPVVPPRSRRRVATAWVSSALQLMRDNVAINRSSGLRSVLLGLSLGLGWLFPLGAIAAPPVPHEFPKVAPRFDIEQFQKGVCPTGVTGVSDAMTSPSTPTQPSLWWIRDQVAAQAQFGNKLIEKWLACPTAGETPPHVDVLVNSQLWTLLDYWERYEAVHRLGTVITGYRYNLRIFNRQQTSLATYYCGLPSGAAPQATTYSPPPPSCTLNLDSASRGGFRGQSSAFDGGFSTTPGTGQP